MIFVTSIVVHQVVQHLDPAFSRLSHSSSQIRRDGNKDSQQKMASKVRIPPLKIEINNETESWKRFLKRFEIASIPVDFGDKVTETGEEAKKKATGKIKGAVFLNCLGEEGMTIFETFNIAVDDIQFDSIVEKFEQHFAGRENKTILRHRFLNMKQERGEELSEFTQRVIKHSHSCQLGELREDMAIHVIINGLSEEKLKTELLQQPEIDMAKLTTTCAKFESAGRTLEELKKTDKDDLEVAAYFQPPARRCTQCHSNRHELSTCPLVECFNCRQRGHLSKDCTNPIVCRSCGKQGHNQYDCREHIQRRGGERGWRGHTRGRGRGRSQGYERQTATVRAEEQREVLEQVRTTLQGLMVDSSSDESL